MKKLPAYSKMVIALALGALLFANVGCSNDSGSDSSSDADDTVLVDANVLLPASSGENILAGKTLTESSAKWVFGDSTFSIYESSSDTEPYQVFDYTYDAETQILSYKLVKNGSYIISDIAAAAKKYGFTGESYEYFVKTAQLLYTIVSQMKVAISNSTVTFSSYFSGDAANGFFTSWDSTNTFRFKSEDIILNNRELFVSEKDLGDENEDEDVSNTICGIMTWNTTNKTFSAEIWNETFIGYSDNSSKQSATKCGTASGTYEATSDTVTLTFTSFPAVENLAHEISLNTPYELMVGQGDSYSFEWTIAE